MKFYLMIAMITVLLFSSAPSQAENWTLIDGVTTADLAAAGWQPRASAGLTLQNGHQSLVTFWFMALKTQFTIRCITDFAADGDQTGDLCKRPSNREIPKWSLQPLANVD